MGWYSSVNRTQGWDKLKIYRSCKRYYSGPLGQFHSTADSRVVIPDVVGMVEIRLFANRIAAPHDRDAIRQHSKATRLFRRMLPVPLIITPVSVSWSRHQ